MESFGLFDKEDFAKWKKYWKGMPEFSQDDLAPYQQLLVSFSCKEDVEAFSKLINQKITNKTKYIWVPKQEKGDDCRYKYYKSPISTLPRYPIYIISKGRWESRLTSKALELCKVPYHIVVEPQEYKKYAEVIDPSKILTLPFSNLKQGSIPARNWVWEHSVSLGFKKHWILDDNIWAFSRLNHNLKIRIKQGAPTFQAIEDFTDRYKNIALAGMQYEMFIPRRTKTTPFVLNTRIYSCLLIDNSIPFKWRGKFNEDTDLSLRVLKAGYCTILFNAFLIKKMGSMIMSGGNTDTIYAETEKRKEFVESLIEQHPDVVKKVWRYNRWHHEVNYAPFAKNQLIQKVKSIPEENNEYGMKFINKTSYASKDK